MAEITYLKHMLKEYKFPNELKKMCDNFLSLRNEQEIKEFANKIGIDTDNLDLNQLKEKIAYELIEKYFNSKK